MSKKIKQSPRYLALEVLTKVFKQGSYSNLTLNQTIIKNQLDARDAHLLTTLVYGVIQRQLTLRYWLKPFIKNPKKIDAWVEVLFLLALYQLQYLDKIPKRAVFNETIEIAKVKGHEGIRKFVTGVLHAIDRQGLNTFAEIEDSKERLSIEASCPLWLVEELINEVGIEKAEKILNSINQAPMQTVRINQKLNDTNEARKNLIAEGFSVEESPVTPLALRLTGGFIPASASFKAGEIFVQDESAMLAVESMAVEASDRVLDACAAPGGKTTQIAMDLADGQVVALDIHQHKVKLIKENAKRAGVSKQVEAIQLDAREVGTKFAKEQFDKILVDAPCSGLGLLRRKPEVKYAKSLVDSQNLSKIQLAILDAVAPSLKPGGKLTYSTCTILRTENQGVITAFLKKHPEFEQVKTKTAYSLKDDRKELGLTIYPDDYFSDGFFIASLEKKKLGDEVSGNCLSK